MGQEWLDRAACGLGAIMIGEEQMSITLAFDVYGTLIDTHAVVAKLQGFPREQIWVCLTDH